MSNKRRPDADGLGGKVRGKRIATPARRIAKTSENQAVAATGQPRKEQGLTQVAYKRVKTSILDGSLVPSSVVSVNFLANLYGMGIEPIRAALHRLCGEDLVEALPQHGYRVLPLTLRDVVQLYDVLGILLPNTARFAARNPRTIECIPQMLALNSCCNTAQPPANEDEERAVIEAGRAVSRLIAECADNRPLLRTLTGLFHQIDRILHIWRNKSDHPIDFRRDYSAVIEALQKGDEDTAQKATAAIVETNKAHIVAGLINYL